MKAEVITIGDELLRGEIVDSNKSFLSDRLLRLDIETHFHASVRDVPADMTDAFHRAARRSDIMAAMEEAGEEEITEEAWEKIDEDVFKNKVEEEPEGE